MNRKIFVGLLGIILLAAVAHGVMALDSDYYRINTGGKTGSFNRDTMPIARGSTLNGTEDPISASLVSSGEAWIGITMGTNESEACYLYIIAKPDNSGIIYRTIVLGYTGATIASDEVVAK